jgi:hypothetical protein
MQVTGTDLLQDKEHCQTRGWYLIEYVLFSKRLLKW